MPDACIYFERKAEILNLTFISCVCVYEGGDSSAGGGGIYRVYKCSKV